jgi:hypothetical protein
VVRELGSIHIQEMSDGKHTNIQFVYFATTPDEYKHILGRPYAVEVDNMTELVLSKQKPMVECFPLATLPPPENRTKGKRWGKHVVRLDWMGFFPIRAGGRINSLSGKTVGVLGPIVPGKGLKVEQYTKLKYPKDAEELVQYVDLMERKSGANVHVILAQDPVCVKVVGSDAAVNCENDGGCGSQERDWDWAIVMMCQGVERKAVKGA